MEARIHPNGELETIEYGQRTVYNLNGDIIYRVEGDIVEEIGYSPNGELEIYRIKVGDEIYQYGSRGECIRMDEYNMDDTIDKLRWHSMYMLRNYGKEYRRDFLVDESLDWEFRMEEEQRCPNYYDNLNNIF